MSFEVQGKGFGKAGGGFRMGGKGFGVSDEDDPLANTKYTGYLDEDLGEQLSDLQKGFQDRAKKERDRYRKAVDSGYWFAVYFKTREQKDAFLRGMKLNKKMYGDLYIDGTKWARQEGIELPEG